MSPEQHVKVSVVIPTYNGGTRFHEVLDAVLEQKNSYSTDIVIVDSSSTDGTSEYCRQMASTHANVNFFSIPQKDFQHGKTRNIAISKTAGDYVALLTQDATPADEHWLENLIAPMLTNEKIAAVFGKHVPYAEADIFEKNSLEKHFEQFGKELVNFQLDDKNRKEFEESASYRGYLCFYSDNNSALRKTVWEKIPYPEVKFAEDQIWAKAIIEKGYIKAYQSKAVVYHSHRFGFFEYLERFKEEGEALYFIHGWRICRWPLQLPKQLIYFVRKDFVFLKTQNLNIADQVYWMKYSFMKNTAKVIGLYRGYKKAIQQGA